MAPSLGSSTHVFDLVRRLRDAIASIKAAPSEIGQLLDDVNKFAGAIRDVEAALERDKSQPRERRSQIRTALKCCKDVLNKIWSMFTQAEENIKAGIWRRVTGAAAWGLFGGKEAVDGLHKSLVAQTGILALYLDSWPGDDITSMKQQLETLGADVHRIHDIVSSQASEQASTRRDCQQETLTLNVISTHIEAQATAQISVQQAIRVQGDTVKQLEKSARKHTRRQTSFERKLDAQGDAVRKIEELVHAQVDGQAVIHQQLDEVSQLQNLSAEELAALFKVGEDVQNMKRLLTALAAGGLLVGVAAGLWYLLAPSVETQDQSLDAGPGRKPHADET